MTASSDCAALVRTFQTQIRPSIRLLAGWVYIILTVLGRKRQWISSQALSRPSSRHRPKKNLKCLCRTLKIYSRRQGKMGMFLNSLGVDYLAGRDGKITRIEIKPHSVACKASSAHCLGSVLVPRQFGRIDRCSLRDRFRAIFLGDTRLSRKVAENKCGEYRLGVVDQSCRFTSRPLLLL